MREKQAAAAIIIGLHKKKKEIQTKKKILGETLA